MAMNKTIRTKCRYCDIDGCLGTCLRKDATHTQQTTAEATEEVENLRKALVYVAFALHDTPQYMLAQGITLIDGDTVRVSRDGWTVEASVNPHRQTAPATVAGSVAVLKFERGTPGRQNEMPRVVSCNWMPDGEYEVYLAAAPTTQTAPAAVAGPSEAVAYLDIGTGGYLDLGTDLADEALSRLPKGRHALVIAGTYGIDGYTATQPAQLADSVLVISAEPAGAVYAELPMQFACSGAFPVYSADQMRAFADATHAIRASHGQALRLLTQNEKDSLGRRAEGMDGNEWDHWVQEKFAQVNGLRVQGGNYDWE